MSLAAPQPLPDAEARMRFDDDGGAMVPQPSSEADAGPVAPRQCGRCRQLFPGDPSLNPGTLQDWWVCPPCRTKLIGDRGHHAG